jgi:hypothetical protein
VAGARLRRLVVEGAVLGGTILAAGGFWLVRNAIEYGSPIYPAAVKPFGLTIFDAPRDLVRERIGFTLADYVGNWAVWGDIILPGLMASFGLAGLVLLSGSVAALAAGLRRRRGADREWRAVALAAAALLVVGVYLVTPDTALGPRNQPLVGPNARYAIPAAILGAPAVAWLAGRVGRAGLVVQLLLLAAVIDALGRPGLETETAGALVLSGLLLAATLVALPLRGRLAELWRRRSAAARAAAVTCLVLAVVAAGYEEQRRFARYRYKDDPTFAWVSAIPSARHRVGVAGNWTLGPAPPVWPMYGPRIGNRVRYVGRLHRGMIRRYATLDAWTAAVRRHRLDLVLVGLAPSRERGWPVAAGFRQVARSDRFALYEVRSR